MFVLDASFTLAWALDDEASEYATEVLNSLSEEDAIVPPLWIVEVSNVLNVGLKRARIQKEAFLDKALRLAAEQAGIELFI